MIGVHGHHIWLFLTIIRQSGDIEENPGHKYNSNQLFSFCQWNLNSMTAHTILKYPFWGFIFHSIISMKFVYQRRNLDSIIAVDDNNLELTGYNLLSVEHVSNCKRGDVRIYYKSSLAMRLIDAHFLKNFDRWEVMWFHFFTSITISITTSDSFEKIFR